MALANEESQQNAELEARLDEAAAADMQSKAMEMKEAVADMELEAKMKADEAAAKQRQASELKATTNAKSAEDAHQDEERIRDMVAQHQEQAERLNEEISKQLDRQHKSVRDRVAKRRQRRDTQQSREEVRKKDGLRRKMKDDLSGVRSELIRSGVGTDGVDFGGDAGNSASEAASVAVSLSLYY